MQPWPPGVLPLDDQGVTITHFDWSFVSRRQVLLFHASACNELTPPLHRAPPGPHAGSSLAEGGAISHAFVPGSGCSPGFDAITKYSDASAVVQPCSSSRCVPDPLIAGLFPSRFPPRLLTGMTLRRFGLLACTASPEGLPPSLAQHGSCWRSSTSSSRSFQDTPPHSFPKSPLTAPFGTAMRMRATRPSCSNTLATIPSGGPKNEVLDRSTMHRALVGDVLRKGSIGGRRCLHHGAVYGLTPHPRCADRPWC